MVLLCAIVSPFCIIARTYANNYSSEDSWKQNYHLEEGWYELEQDSLSFRYSVDACLNANYNWRGLQVGGLNLQTEVAIGFEGFRAGMWWNIGATDWSMSAFNPEVDVYLMYSKYGLTVTLMEMYYFDRYTNGERSRFFDLENHGPGEGGVTTEVRLRYRISDRLPLSILWCTRFSGRDGYYEGGELKRAYSSYLELGYDFRLPWELLLKARVAMTPWKSMYTGFEGGTAVVNTQLTLTRSWQINNTMSLYGVADLQVNPHDKRALWNIGIGLSL